MTRPSPLHMPRRAPAVPSAETFVLALPRLSEELAAIGLEVTDEVLSVAAAALYPVRLGHLIDRAVGPGLVGPAWRRVLDHNDFPLLAVAVTIAALEAAPAACARSLSAVGMQYDRTLVFARAMFGIRVYEHAREMWARQLEYGARPTP